MANIHYIFLRKQFIRTLKISFCTNHTYLWSFWWPIFECHLVLMNHWLAFWVVDHYYYLLPKNLDAFYHSQPFQNRFCQKHGFFKQLLCDYLSCLRYMYVQWNNKEKRKFKKHAENWEKSITIFSTKKCRISVGTILISFIF